MDRDRGATPTGDRDKEAPPRKNKETDDVKAEEASARLEPESSRGPNDGPPSQPWGQGGPKVRLLPSSKERLRRRLKDEVNESSLLSCLSVNHHRMPWPHPPLSTHTCTLHHMRIAYTHINPQ